MYVERERKTEDGERKTEEAGLTNDESERETKLPPYILDREPLRGIYLQVLKRIVC